jgi:hypothetical protein
MTGVVRPTDFPFRYDAPPDVRRFGIDWHWHQIDNSDAKERFIYQEMLFSIPYWLIVCVASSTGFMLSIRPLRERRRMRKGVCPACGYDVRATPDHCPECGLGIASA